MSDVADYTIQPQPEPSDTPGMHDLVIADITQAWAATPSLVGSDEEKGILGVIEELEARKEFGLNKYGTLLQANNGRNAVRDALDEALDLAVYVKQIVTEAKLSLKAMAAVDRMYRDAVELSIGLKFFLLETEANNDDGSRSAEASSPDLAG